MHPNHHDEGLQRERPHGAATDFTADRQQSLPVCPAIHIGTRARKSRRWWPLLALLVLVVFGCLLLASALAGLWDLLFGPVPDVGRDEAAIKLKVAEALPLGSTKEQVEAWLKGQGLPYGTLLDGAGGKPVGFGVCTPYSKQLLSGEVQMEFLFDSDDKLIKETVRIFIPSL